jgi:hypothetical protein
MRQLHHLLQAETTYHNAVGLISSTRLQDAEYASQTHEACTCSETSIIPRLHYRPRFNYTLERGGNVKIAIGVYSSILYGCIAIAIERGAVIVSVECVAKF